MAFLELKIPPVAVTLLFALAMWGVETATPSLAVALPWRTGLAVIFVTAGGIVALMGVFAFRTARTTVDPTRPEAASSIVTSGIYRLSRNPMYLGFLLALVGWAAYLAHVLAAAFVPGFVAYMSRFQIAPEERALAAKFGGEFTAYKQTVRRWL